MLHPSLAPPVGPPKPDDAALGDPALRLLRVAVRQEADRLAALGGLGLLDSGRDAEFDAIVAEAAERLGAPIALVSLIDADRQWFKAAQGLAATETPRQVAFCHYAIRRDDGLVVPDATLDPRFAGNPLVLGEPRIRFYAGLPLRAPTGQAIGTLCVIDQSPRPGLARGDRAALARLADRASMAIARHGAARRFRKV